jgi:PAS domain S-box-containing protein
MDNRSKSNQALKQELAAKEKEISLLKKKSADDSEQLKRLESRLEERMKELRCQTHISDIINSSGLSRDEAIEMIVESIPDAMQFPEIAHASITIGEKVYKTKGFRKTKTTLSRPITLFGKPAGTVEVCYPGLRHSGIDTDFLPEEGDMLFSVAVRLGHFVERKEQAVSLETSENKYRDLLNSMNDTVWVINFDTRILDINNTATRIFGYSREELLSMKIEDIDKNLLPEQISNLARTMKNDEVQVFETSHTTKNGRQIPVEISSSLVSYDGRKAILSIARDLTERKHVEKKLVESEKRFATVFHLNPIPVAITSAADYRILDVNEAWISLTGYSKEESIGRTSDELGLLKPETIKEVRAISEESGTIHQYEIPLFTRKGEHKQVLISSEPIKLGEGRYRLTNLLDVTDRTKAIKQLREREEKYRGIFDGSVAAIFLFDKQKHFVDTNQAGIDLLGFSREELLLMSIPDLDADPLAVMPAHDILLSGGRLINYEHQLLKKDKTVITVLNNSIPLTDTDGNVTGMLSTLIDITRRKEIENALRESKIRYQELFNNISSGVAIYEVRNNGDDFIFKDFNSAAEQIDGDLKGNIIGKSIYEARPGIEKFGLLKVLKRVFQSGIPEQYLEKYYKDERIRSWYNNFIYKLPTGEIVAVFDDITDRKQAEEALLQEKENFKLFLDNSPLGKRITTLEGDSIYANKALLEIYGYDSLREFRQTHLKDRYTPESYIEAQKRKERRQNGDFSDVDYEVCIVRKDGHKRNLRVWRKEILWNGKSQFQVIYNDITERKQALEQLQESESRFSSIFHMNPIGIVLTQLEEGLILNANDTFLKIFGFHREDVIGHTTMELKLYPEPYEHIRLVNRLKEKGSLHKEEVKFQTKSGDSGTILLSAGIIEQYGKPNLLSMLIDITDRKSAEEEILRSREELENLNRRLNDIREEERKFISRELHDQLGQSLTALKIDLNGLQKHIKTDPEALKTLDNVVGMVSESIREVQQISSELRPEILYDLGLVPAVEWYIENFEKRTGIKCHLQDAKSEFADSEKNLVLFRILQEALTNVTRHARASDVWISLCQNKGGIVMNIKDNGTGITKDKIWSSESLGIIGMRERARQFGGIVDISTKKNIGTTLTITLP